MKNTAQARMGIENRNTTDSFEFALTAMMVAHISMIGERKALRMNIMKAFCMLVTSVVSLVVSEAVENLSTLANEKSCTLRKRALLRFLANHIAATALNRAARAPKASEKTDMSIINKPIFTT